MLDAVGTPVLVHVEPGEAFGGGDQAIWTP